MITKNSLLSFRWLASVDIGAFAFTIVASAALAACSAAVPDAEKALSLASKRADGAYGISPTTLQLKASAKFNYVALNVYNTASATPLAPLATNFDSGYITALDANRSYALKIHGQTSGGVESVLPLASYQVKTWDTFAHSTWGLTSVSSDASNGTTLRVSWAYAPWNTLPAGEGAREGAMMRCFFAQDIGAGTDVFGSSKSKTALIYEGQMEITAGFLGLGGLVRVGCEALYIDGTSSRHVTPYSISLNPAVGKCSQSDLIVYDQSYSCGVADVTPSLAGTPGYSLALATGNTCNFIDDSSGTLVGTPEDPDVGTCLLNYVLKGPDGDSTAVSRTVTIANRVANFQLVPGAQQIFEISRNDPAVPLTGAAPNFAAIETLADYRVFIGGGFIRTDKETKGYGAYKLDTSTNSSCSKGGQIYYKDGTTRVPGMNPTTGEFYFVPYEHYYASNCTIDFYFDDGHPLNNRTLNQVINVAILGWNDKPVLSSTYPSGSVYNCAGARCYVGIDYDFQVRADTGALNHGTTIPSLVAEADQQVILKPGNCISTRPTYLRVNYCQLDPVSGNVTISFLPLNKPAINDLVPVQIKIRVSDNGLNSMASAKRKVDAGSNSLCLANDASCVLTPNTFLDSEDYVLTVDIAKFNIPIEPALIVSKAACIACHANVNGDIITDFGNTPAGAARSIAELGKPRFYNTFFKHDNTPGLGGDDEFNTNRASHLEGFRSLNLLTGKVFVKKSKLTVADNAQFMNYYSYLNDRIAQYFPAKMTTDVNLVDFLNSSDYRINGTAQNNHTSAWVMTKGRFVDVCPGPDANDEAAQGRGVPAKVCSGQAHATDQLSGQSIDYMTISAPLPSDIVSLAKSSSGPAKNINWNAADPDAQALYLIPTETSVVPRPFTGLVVTNMQPIETVRAGSSPVQVERKYVRNTKGTPIQCYGDVVIKGDLFLSAPSFATDSRGCRIHVQGNVIFHGTNDLDTSTGLGMKTPGITVTGAGHVGVQITSASAISFGLGRSQMNNSLRTLPQSIKDFALNIMVPIGNECITSAGGVNTRIYEAGVAVDCRTSYGAGWKNLESMRDESVLPAGIAGWDNGLIEYSALMINAPVIQSRYLGDFRGSIISDYALFRLGNLTFYYDHVF
ncbi:MAG: hypothetical protein EOP11_07340, partial [Proteobacteria bacterium]